MNSVAPPRGLRGRLAGVSGRDLLVMVAPALLVIAVGIWSAVKFVRPAPPTSIKMIGGAEGSSYRSSAEKYQKIIQGFGVKVEILPSRGALETL
ncbi:MAG: hypothetical protein ABI560_04825, partial [Myxococcales bacterium]